MDNSIQIQSQLAGHPHLPLVLLQLLQKDLVLTHPSAPPAQKNPISDPGVALPVLRKPRAPSPKRAHASPWSSSLGSPTAHPHIPPRQPGVPLSSAPGKGAPSHCLWCSRCPGGPGGTERLLRGCPHPHQPFSPSSTWALLLCLCLVLTGPGPHMPESLSVCNCAFLGYLSLCTP